MTIMVEADTGSPRSFSSGVPSDEDVELDLTTRRPSGMLAEQGLDNCDDVVLIEGQQQTSHSRQVVSFSLAGNLLEQVVAPGDVLRVANSKSSWSSDNEYRLLVVVGFPRSISRATELGRLSVWSEKVWPSAPSHVQELWCVRTVECRSGLFECVESVLYVEKGSGQLIYLGLQSGSGMYEPEEFRMKIELWQSPVSLRAQLCGEVVAETVKILEAQLAAWAVTAGEAVRAERKPEPSTTYPVIAFWQLYLCRLAAARGGIDAAKLMSQFMPSNANGSHAQQLWTSLRTLGWVAIRQIPMIFQQTVHWEQLAMPPMTRVSGVASKQGLQFDRVEARCNSKSRDNKAAFNEAVLPQILEQRLSKAIDIAMSSGLRQSSQWI